MLRSSTLLALVATAVSSWASPDARTVSTAQSAVRKVIQERVGATQRVRFVESKEKVVSSGESVVSGNGIFSDQSSWRGNHGFDYSVRVDRQSRRTRDLRLTLDTGENLGRRSDWIGTDANDPFVTLRSPAWYQRFQSNIVPFEGEAKGDVMITVFDPEGAKIGEKQVRPSNGRFSTNIQVPRGIYRAVIQPVLSMEYDEVRFSVQSDSSDWGLERPGQNNAGVESLLTVDRPRDNELFENGKVSFSGSSKEKVVKIEVTNGRDQTVLKDTLQVRRGVWSTSANLRDGSYRLLVQTANGKDKDARTFRVSGNGSSTSAGTENIVQISSPRDGATVGTRVVVAGRSSEAGVVIRVYDSRDKLAVDQRVNVRDGAWSLSMTLAAGIHRVIVESQSGRDSDVRRFTVDPRLGGNGNQGSESLLTVAVPTNGTQFRRGIAEFSGTSKESSIAIEVFDAKKNRVVRDTISVRDGRWRSSANLPDGSYTVLIQTASGRDKDSRSFRVSGGASLPHEGSENIVVISSPREGSQTARQLTVSGTCLENAVTLMVYDGANKTVVDRQVNVRNGTWSLTMTLKPGSHRLVVQSQSGRDSDALRFVVK